MPMNEGVVATLKDDGKAEVVIQPVSAGIPGASPRVNCLACHCISDGSTITIEALNSVGAKVGDYVSVHQPASGLAKNAAALLGIPLMGLIVGIILGAFLTNNFSFHIPSGIVAMAICLFSGIGIGVLAFKRVSVGNLPAIDHIIRRRLEAASGWDEHAFCMGAECKSGRPKT